MTPLEEARLGIRAVDKDIAALFEQRMRFVAQILEYKRENGLPVRDPEQEARVLSAGAADIQDPGLRVCYQDVLREEMRQARAWQAGRLYGIRTIGAVSIGKGILDKAAELFNLSRKVLIVTEEGVPAQYAAAVLGCCPDGSLLCIRGGEAGKSLAGVELILRALLDLGFTRGDAIIAVGGGMVGDTAGFAASCYMRGIDYYNVPTTLLAQLDSCVGGKTAVNLGGVKNAVGAFHHPRGVLIDTATLDTLSPRLFAEGLAELVKIAATCDAGLFERLESCTDLRSSIDDFITDAIRLKIGIVRQDPEEKGLRAVLNFGHTIGHAIEAAAQGSLFHGECVAIGMLYMSSGQARERLEALLARFGLPVRHEISTDTLMRYAVSDKKKTRDGFRIVQVEEIGSYKFLTVSAEQLRDIIASRK